MVKLSANQVYAVLSEVPSTLVALVTERDEALQKLAHVSRELEEYRQAEHLSKLAKAMEDKGFMPGTSFEDRIEFLAKKAEVGNLEAVEQAIDMSVPQRPIGWLGEQSGNSADALIAFCTGELVD
jgi:hypothetical protein